MPRSCRDCGQNTGPKRRLCNSCALEARETTDQTTPLETESGETVGVWIRSKETWHASIAFDGHVHDFACGLIFDDFPADGASINHHALAHDRVCPDCRASIDAESMPDPWADAVGVVSLRDSETRDDNAHASATAQTLANADADTLEQIGLDDGQIRCDGGDQ